MSTIEKTMEAMTNMGMAASQARFLGLTSRKSNAEYQAQQINQQRTALANESANLSSEMFNMEVPVPPAESDFYETVYTLEGSAIKDCSDYRLDNMVRINGNDYEVTLTRDVTTSTARQNKYNYETKYDEVNKTHKIRLDDGTGYFYSAQFTYNKDIMPLDDNGEISFETNILYCLNGLTQEQKEQITGYSTCEAEAEKEAEKNNLPANESSEGDDKCLLQYFYKDSQDGKIRFFTQKQLKTLIDSSKTSGETIFYDTYDVSKSVSTTAIGRLETSKETGRYTSLTIAGEDKNPAVPESLRKEWPLTFSREKNKEKYDDAYNDYLYQKDVYEKTMSEINAKSEKIQKQDQQLELKIKQLDTEQNAIKTEMDSVQKVIEDNVEKTFNIFS